MLPRPRSINPIDTPQKEYDDIPHLLIYITNIVEEVNVALNTIQNRLVAGGL